MGLRWSSPKADGLFSKPSQTSSPVLRGWRVTTNGGDQRGSALRRDNNNHFSRLWTRCFAGDRFLALDLPRLAKAVSLQARAVSYRNGALGAEPSALPKRDHFAPPYWR
jgi:hypothetical protein